MCERMEIQSQTTDDKIEMITEWPIIESESLNSYVEDLSQSHKRKHSVCETDRNESECKKSLKNCETRECLAQAALAKWWRRNHSRLQCEETNSLKGCHPNTHIKMIASLLPGKEFISSEIHRLQRKLDQGHSTADVHAALASFLERQKEIEKAVYHIKLAVSLQSDEKEYKWMLHKLERIARIRKIQENGLKLIKRDAQFPILRKVERRTAEGLSVEEFYQNYECSHTPVIITGQKVTTVEWNMERVRHIAGKCNVILRKPVRESVEWAKLETGQTMSVASYIDSVTGSTLTEQLYLFDWSLPINCPPLADELIIPKYFAGDLLKKTKDGSLYRNSWPSLFLSPPGITSELHIDAFGSNFWMALFQGKKRWIFFPTSDVPYLYPEYEHSLDPVFDADLSVPDLRKHPLLQLTHPVECVLEPGDLLFVPSGCPHRVENLEASLAISANFVDQSNLNLVKKELEVNSLLDLRSKELLQQFYHLESDYKMDFINS